MNFAFVLRNKVLLLLRSAGYECYTCTLFLFMKSAVALDLCHRSPPGVVWSPLTRLPSRLSPRDSTPGCVLAFDLSDHTHNHKGLISHVSACL
jgi:hypothetical protein